MWITWLMAGLSIGFLGSVHCIGMCGPIALALPVPGAGRWPRLRAIVLYNIGRSLTYASAGALFGALGNRLFVVGYQQAISIGLGILILFVLLAGRALALESRVFSGLHRRVQHWLGHMLRVRQGWSYLLVGMVNGLLPCGLVYLAVTAALATGSVAGGAILMAGFGMGTFPLMCSLMLFGRLISSSWRQRLRKAVPLMVGLTAVLLILRGMNLGIPLISPEFHQTATREVKGCCHKPH